MATIDKSSEEPHPLLSSYVPSENLSKFSFAFQYFDEKCGWKGQGLGKYEHGLVDPIVVEPHLPLDKSIHIISCKENIPKQEQLVISQLPCDEVDEDLSLEILFVNTLSH